MIGRPRIRRCRPHGTVVFKLLFVDVPVEQVPFLNPRSPGKVYITTDYDRPKRSIRNLSLVEPSDTWIEGMDALVSRIRNTEKSSTRSRCPPTSAFKWRSLYKTFRNWQGEGARPLLSQYKSKNVPARDNSIASR